MTDDIQIWMQMSEINSGIQGRISGVAQIIYMNKSQIKPNVWNKTSDMYSRIQRKTSKISFKYTEDYYIKETIVKDSDG